MFTQLLPSRLFFGAGVYSRYDDWRGSDDGMAVTSGYGLDLQLPDTQFYIEPSIRLANPTVVEIGAKLKYEFLFHTPEKNSEFYLQPYLGLTISTKEDYLRIGLDFGRQSNRVFFRFDSAIQSFTDAYEGSYIYMFCVGYRFGYFTLFR
jgi:hypothetical protein